METRMRLTTEQIQERKKLAKSYETLWKTLANHNRIEILFALCESDYTFSNLMYTIRLNPRSLSSHLKYLKQENIIDQEGKIYSLTQLGEKICLLTFLNDDFRLTDK